jgi:trans-aconitate methyltransferase
MVRDRQLAVMTTPHHAASTSASASPAARSSTSAASVAAQAWNPSLYDSAGAFVPRLGADLVDLLSPRPGERVLDLGCGTGDLTRALAERGAQVVGLDASPDMVAEARRKHPELDFRVGDGQCLAFEDELEGVFSNAALHWMPDAAAVANGVARGLVRGGRFVAELGGEGCVRSVRQAVEASLQELDLTGHALPSWYFPSVGTYASCLERAGLRVRSAAWFERPTPVAGPGGLATWLDMFCGPLLAKLGSQRAELVEATVRRCSAELYRDGAWWLDYTRLRVVATKP